MSTLTTTLKDKDANIILPASDWSVINNKPTNLATTDQLPTLSAWTTNGVTFANGGYSWGSQGGTGTDSHNVAYRIADFKTFKQIELRAVFGCNTTVNSSTVVINLPAIIQPDSDHNEWFASSDNNTTIFWNGSQISLAPLQGAHSIANYMYSFSTVYFTTA